MKIFRIALFGFVLMTGAAFAAQTSSTPGTKTKATDQHAKSTKTAATSGNKNEAAIRNVYDRWAKAFGAHDIAGIMAVYAPGDALVAYDVVPPLEYNGYDAYKKDYEEFLAMFDGPFTVEFREMRVYAGADVGFVHTLERISGKMKDGKPLDMWIRATSGLRKINGKWLIVHDHISVPANFDTGKAEMGLKP
jgi:uncharacterized protein (TIGR02246 family)